MHYTYISGQTPLNEEEKLGLLPNLVTRKDLDEWEQENILEARKWLMNQSILSKYDIFTEKFILNIHKRMFNKVWKWAGKYRKSNKNIGAEYYTIPVVFKELLNDAKFWIEHKSYNISDLAVIFHHRLVRIHLFANGNGRHARFVADIIVKRYEGTPLSWGDSLSNEPEKICKLYINALREADSGNYEQLLAFAKL